LQTLPGATSWAVFRHPPQSHRQQVCVSDPGLRGYCALRDKNFLLSLRLDRQSAPRPHRRPPKAKRRGRYPVPLPLCCFVTAILAKTPGALARFLLAMGPKNSFARTSHRKQPQHRNCSDRSVGPRTRLWQTTAPLTARVAKKNHEDMSLRVGGRTTEDVLFLIALYCLCPGCCWRKLHKWGAPHEKGIRKHQNVGPSRLSTSRNSLLLGFLSGNNRPLGQRSSFFCAAPMLPWVNHPA